MADQADTHQAQEVWPAGKAVRLTNDPGKEGTLTGRTSTRAGTLYYQLRLPGVGNTWQPHYELEAVEELEDWYQMLERGRFGRASDLRRGMTHITLSGRLANVLYSMRTTNTSFLAYQYKPVLAMLDSPCNGLLVADEVGLGKTIEAGLIWTESLRAQKIGEDLFDRLSVAYGLSFEPMEIGQVVPSYEIEGQSRQASPEKATSVHGIDLTDRDQAE